VDKTAIEKYEKIDRKIRLLEAAVVLSGGSGSMTNKDLRVVPFESLLEMLLAHDIDLRVCYMGKEVDDTPRQ
jgi:hypothetical protein